MHYLKIYAKVKITFYGDRILIIRPSAAKKSACKQVQSLFTEEQDSLGRNSRTPGSRCRKFPRGRW